MSDQSISEDDIARAADLQPEPQQQAREPSPQPSNEPQAEPQEPSSDPAAAPQRQPVMVPVGEVQSERKRRQEIETQLAARDRELAESRGRLSAFEQTRQAQPQTPQQPVVPQEFDWSKPETWVTQTAQSVTDERLKPIVEQMRTAQNYNNRIMAEQVHGADTVRSAATAFDTALARGEVDPFEAQRVMNSPNPLIEGVRWFQKHQTLSTVGNDPNKWFETQLEQRLGSDPAFQKMVFDRLQGQAQAVDAQGRAQPVFMPSVNGASGSADRSGGSITEGDIYAAAPQKMGRR